ncbi:MAG TPA: NAD(P)-dependent oxidoreductase [Chloroflexota bacterium]|jgi:uronate dehydrogenase|nr:NAD(P)-dependent oxidoreductase [Chloroflexota bacterium]
MPKRVLITGAAGRIGRSLARQLADRYDLRLQYHNTIPDEHRDAAARARETGRPVALADGRTEVFVGTTEDLAAMERACDGVDAVVHLAGDPRVEAPWESILANNVVGLHNTFEAARRAGTPKLVFASSNHATGFYEKEGAYTTPEMPVRPDSDYGISKAFGEAVGRYYCDAFGMSVVCLRIGSFQARPRNVRHLSTWLSERDCAQLVWRGIEADVPFAVVYGISGNTRAYWDLSSARVLLGYEPEDDAERYAEELLRA